MKRRPRKVIVTVLVFLLLGAVVNIAVAWGFELRPPKYTLAMFASPCDYVCQSPGNLTRLIVRTGQLRISQLASADQRVYNVDYVVPVAPISADQAITMIPSWSAFAGDQLALRGASLLARDDFTVRFSEHSAGWPALALRYTYVQRFPSRPPKLPRFTIDHCDGVLLPDHWRTNDRVALPWWPIWPGFAINTLFYAAILWLLLALPWALRRWRRSKRGLCPACAYPVGASDLCTECGMPVTRRFAA